MSSTAHGDPAPPRTAQTTGRGRRRPRRAVGIAALATLSVLAPGALATSMLVAAPPALASSKHKPAKHKCKKGFVYQHGKCRASARPVY